MCFILINCRVSQRIIIRKNLNEIYFNFSTGSLDGDGNLISNTTDLGYVLENTDEFGITGKFIEE